MSKTEKQLKICPNGHEFYKSSDCPVCPVCEAALKPEDGWLEGFSAPARRALEHAGILTVKQLSQCTQKEVLSLHGMGPASLPRLKAALASAGLEFKKQPSQ